MAQSCRARLARVEVETLQPVDRFVRQLKEVCEEQECVWYLLCLNKVFCWTVWVVAKVCEWVLILAVRWVYQLICIIVSLVIGLLALLILRPDILIQAIIDLFVYLLDVVHFVIGLVLFIGNILIDIVLTTIKLQDEKRELTKEEINVLRPLFGDSIPYSMIKINEGNIGIMRLGSGNGSTTMGYNIYSRNPNGINLHTLVHECVHVWQFQYAGTNYIGQSVFTQLLNGAGIMGNPYNWEEQIGTDPDSWYVLPNIEAQAEFIMDLFTHGQFIDDNDLENPKKEDGAFFIQGLSGRNQFTFSRGPERVGSDTGTDYTVIANEAWRIINTG